MRRADGSRRERFGVALLAMWAGGGDMNDLVVLVVCLLAIVGAGSVLGAVTHLPSHWQERREARKRTKVLAARIHELAQRIR